jgi:hypothetical protein
LEKEAAELPCKVLQTDVIILLSASQFNQSEGETVEKKLKKELEESILTVFKKEESLEFLRKEMDDGGHETIGDLLVEMDLPFNGKVEKELKKILG